MKKPLKIGKKEFKFKKDAVTHYKTILNSYEFEETLNDSDYDDILALLDYSNDINNEGTNLQENTEIDEGDLVIDAIKVAKVQFNTKCFELYYNDECSEYISYLMLLGEKRYTPEKRFNIACRNSIHDDIHDIKQRYFDKNSVKGQVKCQETGILSKWTELVLDHRQPNTFSIILDRFKEVYPVSLNSIEYTTKGHLLVFADKNLAQDFRKYHKEKANFRLIRKECNSSRTGMARVKKSAKDLTVK
jgi:hypothetical protein